MESGIKTAIILGVGIIVAIAGISLGFSSLESTESIDATVESDSALPVKIDKSRFKMAPDLVGIEHFLNTTPEQLEKDIENKVILYDVWTYSCINCIRTLPYITAWDDKYADQGLLIVGIHSPEFEFEKDVHNVEMAVEKHGIKYPVVLDNEMKTWKAFENRYWPRKYVADHEGYIRYDHIGEGAYKETEKIIQQLLEERSSALGLQVASAKTLVDIEAFEHTSFRTPELYFGYKFAQNRNQLGNIEGFSPGKIVEYSIPEELQKHYFYLDGDWQNLEGSMKLVSQNGVIKLPYQAKQVNIVSSSNAELEIFLDGEPLPSKYAGADVVNGNKIFIEGSDLYNIISSNEANSHLLEISVSDTGFEIYTFTFG